MAFPTKKCCLALAISIVFLYSCSPKRIPEKDMVPILADIYITDAVVSAVEFSMQYVKRDTIEYYKHAYAKYGYNSNQFYSTIDYYIKNPAIFDKVLDKVINHLSKIEAEKSMQYAKERDNEVRLKAEILRTATKFKYKFTIIYNWTPDSLSLYFPQVFLNNFDDIFFNDDIKMESAIKIKSFEGLPSLPELKMRKITPNDRIIPKYEIIKREV